MRNCSETRSSPPHKRASQSPFPGRRTTMSAPTTAAPSTMRASKMSCSSVSGDISGVSRIVAIETPTTNSSVNAAKHRREATLHGCRSFSGVRSQSERCVSHRIFHRRQQTSVKTQPAQRRAQTCRVSFFGVVSAAIEPMVDESLYAASQGLEKRGNQQRPHDNHNGLRL